jgi:hypothetical protein
MPSRALTDFQSAPARLSGSLSNCLLGSEQDFVLGYAFLREEWLPALPNRA